MSDFKSRKIFNLWNKTKSLDTDISILKDKQNQIDIDKKNRNLNFLKKIHIVDSGWIAPILFSTLWKETWTQNSPLWQKTSIHHSIGEDWYDDSEPKITFHADKIWSTNIFNFVIFTNNVSDDLLASSTLDLSNGGLNYQHSIVYTTSGSLSLDCVLGLDFGQSFIMKNLSSNSILSWDGSFTGSVSVAGKAQNWAYIVLEVKDLNTMINSVMIFVKYGINSKSIIGTNIKLLSSWSGNYINIFQVMQDFGYNMNHSYKARTLQFCFRTSIDSNVNPGLTANMNVSIDNLKLT